MRALAFVLGAVGLGTLALTVGGRAGFPWPLEWMEGATLQHALRLLEGNPIYLPPSAEFVPYLYPPLAYVPMAVSAWTFGPTLPAARAPSILALAGTLFLVGRVCAPGSGSRLGGWLAAGVFAAGYGYTGAFLDLARVDALFVFLVVAGAERLHARCAGASLALFLLSAFTKQHGALFLLAASAWLLAVDPKRHRLAIAATWLVGALAYTVLTFATDGWFHRYVVALPATHPLEPTYLASFFVVDVIAYLPALALAATIALRRGRWREPLSALLCAGFVAGALGRAHPGGHDNVRLPAFAMLVLVAMPPLARAMFSATPDRTRVLAAFALAAQLAILWQPPTAHWPPPESAPAFAALARALARCANGGPAAALDHALLTRTPFVHTMALSDLMLGANVDLRRRGTDALLDGLRRPDAPRALAVGKRFPALDALLRDRYRECARVRSPPLATGYQPADDAPWQVVYALAQPHDLP